MNLYDSILFRILLYIKVKARINGDSRLYFCYICIVLFSSALVTSLLLWCSVLFITFEVILFVSFYCCDDFPYSCQEFPTCLEIHIPFQPLRNQP